MATSQKYKYNKSSARKGGNNKNIKYVVPNSHLEETYYEPRLKKCCWCGKIDHSHKDCPKHNGSSNSN